MSTQERRLHVLRAIVIEHVATNEPVSSKTVAQEYVSDVSSATIRSDMSALEDQGYIQQPHTSAGRTPTEAGYRIFVDNLGRPKPLSEQEMRQLEGDLERAEDRDDIIERTARLLARLTRQAAVVELPDLSLLGIRKVELIDLGPNRVLVLVISTSGRIAERQIEFSAPDDPREEEASLRKASAILTEACADLDLQQAPVKLDRILEKVPANLKELLELAADAVTDMVRPMTVSRFAIAGASNLARTGMGFRDVSTVLEALEQQAPIAGVLRDLHTGPVQVSIGTENENDKLSEVSVVSATYDFPARHPVHVGVIGPTRMDYPNSLGAVKAVSEHLSKLLLNDLGIEKEDNA